MKTSERLEKKLLENKDNKEHCVFGCLRGANANMINVNCPIHYNEKECNDKKRNK